MVFRVMKRGYAADYRDMETVMVQLGYPRDSDLTVEASQQVLNEMYQDFSQLEGAMRNLEQIKPRSKELLDVHVAMVGFLRAFLLVQDNVMMYFIEIMKDNNRQANKRKKEVQQWSTSLEEARQLLRKKIAELERKRPDTMIGMRISASCLGDLGLR